MNRGQADDSQPFARESMRNPKVSIGMPVYNGSSLIRGALDSLLSQTFEDFDLIISDNASTDETEQICREYESHDPRIHYIKLPKNLGPAANFKSVLSKASGEYFMWAAHDDRWKSDCLELWVRVLDENPSVGLVFSGVKCFNHLTGDSFSYVPGFSASRHKMIRILFRLCQGCSALIYGLHRTRLIRSINLMEFDFFDVYLSLWYELNSSIRVVPVSLFISGTYGDRMPYSISGIKISDRDYLRSAYDLFMRHFSFPEGLLLFVFLWFQSKLTLIALSSQERRLIA